MNRLLNRRTGIWLTALLLVSACQPPNHPSAYWLSHYNPPSMLPSTLEHQPLYRVDALDTYPTPAIESLLQQHMFQQARWWLRYLETSHPRMTRPAAHHLFKARLALQVKQPRQALKALNELDFQSLNPLEQQQHQSILTRIHLQKRRLASAITTLIQPGVSIPRLLYRLSQMEPSQAPTHIPETAGWFDLGLILKHNLFSPHVLRPRLAAWYAQHPTHPAYPVIKPLLHTRSSPQQIALLLPLSGSLGEPGRAVHEGIMSAFYQIKRDQTDDIGIRLYNTYQQDIQALYQQAMNDGATWIIGPLAKAAVAELLKRRDFPVPTLVLNQTTQKRHHPQLYFFSLSPKQEMIQMAFQAWRQGSKRALIIAPNDTWGHELKQILSQQWQQLGGDVIDQWSYTHPNQFNHAIAKLMGIEVQKKNKKILEKHLKQPLQFIPQHRQDIDCIMLIATSSVAQQIKPLLKYHYAEQIPVIGTSMVHKVKRSKHHDLNGLMFCDMPSIIDGTLLKRYQPRLTKAWPDQLNSPYRLFALGRDAMLMSQYIHALKQEPRLGLMGTTGYLYLDKTQVIQRQLTWAQFQGGQPQLYLD